MSELIVDEHPYSPGNLTVRVPTMLPPKPKPRQSRVAWYIPYTRVHARTLAGAPLDAVWVDVSADPDAYWAALEAIWTQGESFAVLEHDVACRPDVVRAFEECPEPWCTFAYSDVCHPGCVEAHRNNLGCTRFRADVLLSVPEAVSSIPSEDRHWQRVCDYLGNNLRDAGLSHHWHEPWVEHHHFR